jgi:hypothetical protein
VLLRVLCGKGTDFLRVLRSSVFQRFCCCQSAFIRHGFSRSPAMSAITVILSPLCHPERGARERARESKDPGAAGCDHADSGSSPQTLGFWLSILAITFVPLHPPFLCVSKVLLFDCSFPDLRLSAQICGKRSFFSAPPRLRGELLLSDHRITRSPAMSAITVILSPPVILSVARGNARASRRIPVQPVVTMPIQGVLPKHSVLVFQVRQFLCVLGSSVFQGFCFFKFWQSLAIPALLAMSSNLRSSAQICAKVFEMGLANRAAFFCREDAMRQDAVIGV